MKVIHIRALIFFLLAGGMAAGVAAQSPAQSAEAKHRDTQRISRLQEFEDVFQQTAASAGLSNRETSTLLAGFKAKHDRRQIAMPDLRAELLELLYKENIPYGAGMKFLDYLTDRLKNVAVVDVGFLDALRTVDLTGREVHASDMPGIQVPRLTHQSLPPYTKSAELVRLEGTIFLEAVVLEDGSVANVEVIQGLGYGLNESAVLTIQDWKFEPGTLNGKPVPVRIKLDVHFRLL